MPLTSDRKRRVEQYLAALKRRLITQVASIEIEMATNPRAPFAGSSRTPVLLSLSALAPWGGEWRWLVRGRLCCPRV